MGKKKLSPQDGGTIRSNSTKSSARRPNTQRPTDKSMTLYTMSGKKTTIAERDGTSEEERMADIRARLFTLFDEDAEKEREEEQNRLRNRATGAFLKIKNIIGDGEDGYDAGSAEREAPPAAHVGASPGTAKSGMDERSAGRDVRAGSDVNRPTGAARNRARPERPAEEEPKKRRVEQERRVKPVNPVRAMDTETFEKRGKHEAESEGRAPRTRQADARARQRQEEDAGSRATRPGPEPARSEAKPARPGPKPARAETKPARPDPKPAKASKPEEKQPVSPDASFKLGDLFRDEEPDILSRLERDDEEERRIRERRAKRRAEAARRAHGEYDGSKMRTAAALFIAREGMRNFFGKFSGPLDHGAHEEEEREAEQALRELAGARDESRARLSEKSETPRRTRVETGPEDENGVATDMEAERDSERAGIHAMEEERDSERAEIHAMEEERASERTEIHAMEEERASERAGIHAMEEERDSERTETRPVKAARASARSGHLPAKGEGKRSARKTPDIEERPAPSRGEEDAALESGSYLNLFKRPSRLSRTTIAWIAGSAAGAVAVVIIAFIIVNNHTVDVSARSDAFGYVENQNAYARLVDDVGDAVPREISI